MADGADDVGASVYAFGASWDREDERLAAISRLFDQGTTRLLRQLPWDGAWRCVDVGAGTGSVARWMAQHPSSAAPVVALDVEPRYVARLSAIPAVEGRLHDIDQGPWREAGFDLVHARFLLMNVARPQEALRHLAAMVAPGGWLVVEDGDSRLGGVSYPASDAIREAAALLEDRSRRTGASPWYGASLPLAFDALEFEDVEAEGRFAIMRWGSEDASLLRLGLQQMLDTAEALPEADFSTITRALSDLEGSAGITYTMPVISVRGRRPHERAGAASAPL